MKGFRYYALVGSLTVAVASLAPSFVLAADVAPSPTGHDRGVRLDQLFTMFKTDGSTTKVDAGKTQGDQNSSSAAPANSKLAKAPAAPASLAPHHALKPHQIPPTAIAKNGHHQTTAEVALYKTGDSNPMEAVSHAMVANSATSVISATLDRPGTVPKYKAGDHMVVNVKALQDCNVVVFDFDAKGTLTQLFPNEFEHDGAMHAGQSIEIGGEASQYTLDIGGSGMERIFVYAYPLAEGPITVAMAPVEHTPFRAVNLSRAQYDRLINDSKEYNTFSDANATRSVNVVGRSQGGIKPVSNVTSDKPSNKLELFFQIEKK